MTGKRKVTREDSEADDELTPAPCRKRFRLHLATQPTVTESHQQRRRRRTPDIIPRPRSNSLPQRTRHAQAKSPIQRPRWDSMLLHQPLLTRPYSCSTPLPAHIAAARLPLHLKHPSSALRSISPIPEMHVSSEMSDMPHDLPNPSSPTRPPPRIRIRAPTLKPPPPPPPPPPPSDDDEDIALLGHKFSHAHLSPSFSSRYEGNKPLELHEAHTSAGRRPPRRVATPSSAAMNNNPCIRMRIQSVISHSIPFFLSSCPPRLVREHARANSSDTSSDPIAR